MSTDPFQQILATYRDTRPRPLRWRVADGDTRLLQAVAIGEEMAMMCLYEDAGTMQSYLCPAEAWGKPKGTKKPKAPDLSRWHLGPVANSLWTHRDRDIRVLTNATWQSTGEHLVVYRDEPNRVIWTCSIDTWLEAGRFTQRSAKDGVGKRP